ncbi:hypothetical protein [Kitasatospora azatica]|uniref:hypothetical protein n=1 Tax=Kitasatospora azatica TaxID=58347 RepID=UPI00068D2036|nr:hypothetical protein [Kitasatospora azatica]
MSEPQLRDAACHELLLALAGRLPDDALRAARRALADGEISTAAATALDALADRGAAVTPAELTTARQLAGDPDPIEQLGGTEVFLTVDQLPDLPYQFVETGPGAAIRRDAVDDALLLAAEACGEQVEGVWRCWRQSVFGEEPDRRVYLVQTGEPAAAPALAGTCYDALDAVGEQRAGVEVVAVGAELTGYQRRALDAALLLWASGDSGAPEFQVARIYDQVDPVHGPGFAPDHPLVEDLALRARLLEYLAAGRPVLSTTSRMPDPLDPAAGDVVPLGFLTDGEWVWTEAVGYFLERHGLAPDPALLAHIRYADFIAPAPDDETVSRAADFLLLPDPDEEESAVWVPGEH